MITIGKKTNLIVFSILVIIVSTSIVFYHNMNNKNHPTNTNVKVMDNSIVGTLETIIKSDIQKKDSSIKFDKFNIVSTNIESYAKLAMYLFESKNVKYEGLCILSNNDNITNDYTVIDKKASFTNHQLGGSTDVIGIKFVMYSGVVNTKGIDSLLLDFNDGSKVNIKLGENKCYFYVKNGANCKINNISALDKNLNCISKYPPYPPQKP